MLDGDGGVEEERLVMGGVGEGGGVIGDGGARSD